MKKAFIIIALTFPVWTFAASGACSGHGGVSCSAGADSDGSVICNDGWTNSSVSYSSMKMCESSSATSNVVVPTISNPEPEPQPVIREPVKAEVIPVKTREITSPPKTEVRKVEKKTIVQQPATTTRPKVENVAASTSTGATSKPVAPTKKKGFISRLVGFFF